MNFRYRLHGLVAVAGLLVLATGAPAHAQTGPVKVGLVLR